MRKNHQRLILELLQTIKQAQSTGLYADCQDGALAVGGFIEDIEGEGTQTVALLEEYCDLLFKASTGEIGEKQLQRYLLKIENSVKSELKPDKIEIAFLTYNASMSDSIESIYLAAKADPTCDAYWIPIPFYELNPDGSIGAIHCEGTDFYGKDTECIDWQKYDIETRHPDVIFTFAPYDDGNYVTRVHPDFYCKRLRGLTDLLVYVPYFVVSDVVPEYFCTIAGCLYAHKVVVQSEKIRDTYIRVFKEAYGNRFGKPEEKFIALGSPKFDKTINTRREDCELPDEWRDLIGNKKVVFYNTSVGPTLEGGEQHLRKLRSVLNAFRSRDDVLLWWRPHPLSEATYMSMRPQLLDEYKAAVNDCKSGGWCIYDDSSGLHRAIAWSDAYYGDWSSLVALYRITGKPLFLQSTKITNHHNLFDEHGLNIVLSDFTVRNDVLWGVAQSLAGLFSMDLRTGACKYHGGFPGERMFGDALSISIEAIDDYIIMVPYNSNAIVKYDLCNNEYECIPVSDDRDKFFDSHKYNENLIIIPHTYHALLIYNSETNELTENRKLCIDLDKVKDANSPYFYKGGIIQGDVLVLASGCCNAIVKYDMKTNKYEIHNVGNTKNKYISITYDGENYWLFTLNDCIVKWNEKTGIVREIDRFPDGFKHGKYYDFYKTFLFQESIFAFPYQSNMILKINIHSNKIVPLIDLDLRKAHFSYAADSAKYPDAKTVGEFIYAMSDYENCMQKIDPSNGEVENIPLVLSNDDYSEIMRSPLFAPLDNSTSPPWMNYETPYMSLAFFLDRLANESVNTGKIRFDGVCGAIENPDGSSGVKIYDYVKSEVVK